MLRQVEKHCLQ